MATSVKDYKAKTRTELTLPSGAVFSVRRPSPEIAIKAGRLPSSLATKFNHSKAKKGETITQIGERVLKTLTDEELKAYLGYATDLVADVTVSPRLVVGASGEDEMDPSDLESADFWHLFGWASAGGNTLPVKTKGGELTVDELETFRGNASIREAEQGSEETQQESVAVAGN